MYAKPQNKTPTNFSTHIEKIIFTFFIQQYTILITDQQFHKPALFQKIFISEQEQRSLEVVCLLSAFQMWRKMS